jgi:hypothetical protein
MMTHQTKFNHKILIEKFLIIKNAILFLINFFFFLNGYESINFRSIKEFSLYGISKVSII